MALVNPNIAMSFRMPEFTPRNALAEYAQIQQIQGGQRQAEMADMQLEALRRDRDTLGKIQAAIVAKGGPPDLAAAADEMIRSGKPDYITQGQAIRQKLADQLAFANYQKEFAPGAAPTGMPAPAPEPGSFAADTAARRAALPVNAFAAPVAAPVNALAPAAAPAAPVAPVNAMVGQPDIAALEARYRRVANLETPGAKAEAALLLKQIDRAATATPADIKTMQALGYPITQAGFRSYRDAQREQRLLTPEEEAQRARLARAGASNITLSTERKYGDRFGGLIAESDAAKLSAAENAPRMAENADRITDLLATGKVITGTGANVRLQIAKALNLAGGTDSERIKNTEVLVSSLAETTLGAIKASNLGAGQGFTNADRDFLEKAVAGQLSYDQKSLGELARLSRKAAEKSAEAWNKRAPNIPKSALEGTGYSTEPVIVPPRQQKAAGASPAPKGVDQALWNVMTPEERKLWQK
jgi:hypothetical protein